MRTLNFFMLSSLLLLAMGCKKDAKDNKGRNSSLTSNEKIPVEIQINQVDKGARNSGHYLSAIYNGVIDADVTFKVQIPRTGGLPDTVITATIPAGYKNLIRDNPSGMGNINLFEYYIGPTGNFDVDEKVLSIQSPDKKYVFSSTYDKINCIELTTTVYFKANHYVINYNDFSYVTSVLYQKADKSYAFSCYNALRVKSGLSQPALFVGQKIKMPYFKFYYGNKDYGTEVDANGIAPGSGSTVEFTITAIGDKTFDAIFSGKVWSKADADTSVITEGRLMHAKLPE